MGILSKHIGTGEPFKVGEDEILLKPLSTEDIPKFFKVMRAFSGAKEGAPVEDMLKNIDDEGLEALKDIINRTLDISLPNEPDEERKAFGMKYMMQLLPKIMEINIQPDKGSEQDRKMKVIQRLQQGNGKT